ncbi:UNVERIFIED_CONTAM: Alpha-L-arabinofuranosidase 1 [Sesamum calycinum]|uniref:non-reducing end alpha-L-arabinofuranosidase n=1 Tax=Sesamum calycinum TaxID=2727403 RepID=A0AAW2RU56_9LAMI
MGAITLLHSILLFFFILLSALYQSSATGIGANQTISLFVNASEASAKKIPDLVWRLTMLELEDYGRSLLTTETGHHALIEIKLHCEWRCFGGHEGTMCPASGVGIYNPGFWGMVQVLLFQSSRGLVTRLPIGPKFVLQNIEQGKTYKLVLYARSLGPINVSVSLIGSTGLQLASANIVASDVSNWTKLEAVLQAKGTDANSRLQLTTTRKGVIWFDQVSLMPTDTYKGHGFRNDLFEMVKNMRPAFIRFPGGCFVEGEWLRNAFRWKETIGPWEERPGHFGDVWHYWTDDGLGHFEFLQLAEDLGALPVWVFNNGVSHNDEVDTSSISPFLQEILDGIEFARGDRDSKWGSVRAAMGHPEPFDLRYVAVGNEDCGKKNYLGTKTTNVMTNDKSTIRINLDQVFFANLSRDASFLIEVTTLSSILQKKCISRHQNNIKCDGSSRPLDHPADLYDYHIYSSANNVFASAQKFDKASRNGPKAFVSEYAVTGNDAGKGSLLAALAEAGFLIGLEKNWWNPDAIVFDSSQAYGTPSYWMQHFFRESNGATLLSSTLQPSSSIIASAITWKDTADNKHLRIKVVNFGSNSVILQISIVGLEVNSLQSFGSTKTELTSISVMDENSFQVPNKIPSLRPNSQEESVLLYMIAGVVVPVKTQLDDVGEEMDTVLSPHSVTSLDFVINSDNIRIFGSDAVDKSPY